MNPWIKTKEKVPTAKDANRDGDVVVSTARGTVGYENWEDVAGWYETYPLWITAPTK